jgi:hypothetical protein
MYKRCTSRGRDAVISRGVGGGLPSVVCSTQWLADECPSASSVLAEACAAEMRVACGAAAQSSHRSQFGRRTIAAGPLPSLV